LIRQFILSSVYLGFKVP